MIHEEICTYEVAKLAKEKGFNEYVEAFYAEDCNIPHTQGPEKWNEYKGIYAAPTQSLLQRWLREERGIHISVEYEWVEGIDDWTFYAYIKKVNNAKVVDDAIKSGFNTYELALEDTELYCLKNLL